MLVKWHITLMSRGNFGELTMYDQRGGHVFLTEKCKIVWDHGNFVPLEEGRRRRRESHAPHLQTLRWARRCHNEPRKREAKNSVISVRKHTWAVFDPDDQLSRNRRNLPTQLEQGKYRQDAVLDCVTDSLRDVGSLA